MKEIDPTELSGYDGKEGRPTYIAHGGRVIDVSGSALWKGGTHMMRHQAGHDLTTDITAAPHGLEVLERYPQVGVLKEVTGSPSARLPSFLESLFSRYPILRRHPHPSMVHFPIVFSVCASVFSLLFVATGARGFDTSAMYCLAGAILITPLAIFTGYVTWWVNYGMRPMRRVTIKRRLSFVVLGVLLVTFGWRLTAPDILDCLDLAGLVYLLLVLSLAPMVLVIAYQGGCLTFPVEERRKPSS